MESFGKTVEGSLVDYENLDNHQNGIHEYLKILKHGYGRITDQASILIRRGLITREEGLHFVKKNEVKFPWTYLGRPLQQILDEIDITLNEFRDICDRYTNRKLFKCDRKGNLIRDKKGNLIFRIDKNL